MNKSEAIIQEVKKKIYGKDTVIRTVLAAMIAGGHVLIEDVPGVGKTTLALSFSKAMGLNYGRVQFTPDVLPSDITGFSIYDKETGTMKYQPGNVFHNLFLADELNRASSRTQSALLEAMEEGQVTVDDKTYLLPTPFITFATQNPSGAAGTSLLPDSQLDRFTIRISMGYPSLKSEMAMIHSRQANGIDREIEQVCTVEEMCQMQAECKNVHVADSMLEYIVKLVAATRENSSIERGASPRATLALTDMAKAHAYVKGQDYITPDDVKIVFEHVIAHRILLTSEADIQGVKVSDVLEEIVKTVATPKV